MIHFGGTRNTRRPGGETRGTLRLRKRLALLCGVLLLCGCAAPTTRKLSARTAAAPTSSPTISTSPSPTSASTPSPSPSPTPEPTPSPSSSPTPEPTSDSTSGPPAGYTLVFAEEFDANGKPDESVWTFDLGPWPYNEELECYTADNAFVENGALVIEARAEETEGCAYTSARLNTKGKLDFTYGYLEVRAALPVGRGTWSAIWLLPTGSAYGGYLESGEIDIAERVGFDAKRVYSTLHTERNNSTLNNAITESARLSRKDDGFHIYALLWEENAIRIYLDGVQVLCYARPENAASDEWPFDLPFHVLLNVAVGGTWGGVKGVDDDAFPQRMLVDYVRLYAPPG